MGTATLGKVHVAAKIENLEDLYKVHQGVLTPDQVRTLDVTDALVDTGATGLMVPTHLLPALGLRPTRRHHARSVGGTAVRQWYDAVRLTVRGRECSLEVCEVPDDEPVQLGLIPLGALDLVIDSSASRLVGNPEHGGEHTIEAVSAWL